MPQPKRNPSSEHVLKQLYKHAEEIAALTDMLKDLLLLVEGQMMPKRIRDLSLAIAMSYRLTKTTKAMKVLAQALRAESNQ